MPEAPRARSSGFRLWPTDVAVILAAPQAAWWLAVPLGPVAWALPVALAHFFLFCNVFRVRRGIELAWAGVFVVHVAAWLALDSLRWPLVIGLQAPVTLAVIAVELRSPGYHGILARRINPRLDEWLAGGA